MFMRSEPSELGLWGTNAQLLPVYTATLDKHSQEGPVSSPRGSLLALGHSSPSGHCYLPVERPTSRVQAYAAVASIQHLWSIEGRGRGFPGY